MPAFRRRALLCSVLLLVPALPVLADEAPVQPAVSQPEQLQIIDHKVGTGQEVRIGAFVVAHYAGYVFDPDAPDHKGRKFVSSRDRGEALTTSTATSAPSRASSAASRA
jgi:hypothetical protein